MAVFLAATLLFVVLFLDELRAYSVNQYHQYGDLETRRTPLEHILNVFMFPCAAVTFEA